MVVATVAVYDIGDLVRLGNHTTISGVAAFTNASGTATDPTTTTMTVRKPDGTLLIYSNPTGVNLPLLRESAGRFYADVSLTQEGTWWYGLGGTEPAQAYEEDRLYVRPQRVVTG